VIFGRDRAGGLRVVGHRGGRGSLGGPWPTENTLESFARAHAEGAPAIELDVRVCIGGGVVVMHDPDLARTTGGRDRRHVAQMTRGLLARVALEHGERVPMLDDVLDWARGRVAVNVEAKHDVPDRLAAARGIARALARHPGVEVLLSSFDPTLLGVLAALAPRVPRAWLTHAGQDRWSRAWMPVAERAPIAAVHVERTQASWRLVEAFHRAGKAVGVWTVNDPTEARALMRMGVDWLITDAPGAMLEALGSVCDASRYT
jgi:glycerophosphoryl diester phosphodiesterase